MLKMNKKNPEALIPFASGFSHVVCEYSAENEDGYFACKKLSIAAMP